MRGEGAGGSEGKKREEVHVSCTEHGVLLDMFSAAFAWLRPLCVYRIVGGYHNAHRQAQRPMSMIVQPSHKSVDKMQNASVR